VEELLLALLELGDRGAVDQVLQRVRGRFGPSEEMLCRQGRSFKDQGVAALRGRNELTEEARQLFGRALECYELAYQERRHYYPGINVVSLRRVLGDAGDVSVEQVLQAARANPTYEGESVWLFATQGEALFLLGEHAKAEEVYRKATTDRFCTNQQSRDSMKRQLTDLLLPFDAVARAYWTAEKLQSVFTPMGGAATPPAPPKEG
jgi:hypothetical protein